MTQCYLTAMRDADEFVEAHLQAIADRGTIPPMRNNFADPIDDDEDDDDTEELT